MFFVYLLSGKIAKFEKFWSIEKIIEKNRLHFVLKEYDK